MAVQRADSERLRESFAEVLRSQALEASHLAGMVGGDADLRDAVGEMLERVQKTARSLHLDHVEQVAAAAARAMEAGGGADALTGLLDACRAIDPTAEALRRILVVGVAEPEGGGDPLLRFVPTIDAAVEAARQEAPLAVVLPIAAFDKVGAGAGGSGAGGSGAGVDAGSLEIGGAERFADVPRYAWGHDDDVPCRLAAARAGALAYFAAPLELRTLAARVRVSALTSGDPDRLLLVGPAEAVAKRWVQALAGLPVEVSVLHGRASLLATLEEIDPTLVVLAGPHAAELALVLRGHPDWWDLPRVLVADELPVGLIELVLPASLPVDRLRIQGLALLERARLDSELRAAERSTGVLPRVALIRAAERETAIARRTRQPLAVARIDLDEPAALRRTHGSAATGAAVRILARALREALRTTDIVGRVGDHGFGVLLPGASASSIRGRLQGVERRFLELAASDPRLARATATAGFADLDEGADGLFQRADLDRVRARRGR
ncbi:MAG: diguanylate cyclase [Pseudomonadota bacterium]|nr:diguanylate cyclase [Pseudomonadota bacterium]